jgi:signal transduction histidine kinase
LFIDFSKLDENSQRNKQGTGLGLSICKKIIEKMGGSVKVKSTPGVGTKFIINVKTKCQVQEYKLTKNIFEENHGIGEFTFI